MAAQGEKKESRAQQQQQQQLLPTVERTQQVLAPQMTAGKSVEQVVAQDQGPPPPLTPQRPSEPTQTTPLPLAVVSMARF